jgi:hypothetical protein
VKGGQVFERAGSPAPCLFVCVTHFYSRVWRRTFSPTQWSYFSKGLVQMKTSVLQGKGALARAGPPRSRPPPACLLWHVVHLPQGLQGPGDGLQV